MRGRAGDGAVTENQDPVITMTGFARALRSAGVAADATRLAGALDALTHIDVLDAEAVYWAGRVTLCGEPDDLPRYDAVFDAWFRGRVPPVPGPRHKGPPAAVLQLRPIGSDERGEQDAEHDDEVLNTAASDTDVLASRDVAGLSQAERDEVNALIALLAPGSGRAARCASAPGAGTGWTCRAPCSGCCAPAGRRPSWPGCARASSRGGWCCC